MSKISYVEKPEVLKETIELFLKDLSRHEQFDGTFRDGRIKGEFFSTRLFDVRRLYSFVQIEGSYNLEKGILTVRLFRTTYYYFVSIMWLFFAIAGSVQALNSPYKLLFLFPVSLGFFGIAMYHFAYVSRVSEFLKTFNHYLNLSRERFNSD